LDDLHSWLSQPCTGTVETLAAPFWRWLPSYRPDVRIVTVRRPVSDVVASLEALGFDPAVMMPAMRRLDRKLDQVEARVPGVLTVPFSDLSTEAGCGRLFEHCLPYEHDPKWWGLLRQLNIQVNMGGVVRYMAAHRAQTTKLAKQLEHRIIAAMRPPEREFDGITFQVEPFREFYRDAEELFREHLTQTDQAPDDHMQKNLELFARLDDIGGLQVLTARGNGRMFGYLVSVVAPSLDKSGILHAEHTIFFASAAVRGLGMRLQREAAAKLRERGCSSVLMRAGHRGSGPRLGTFYRRLGADEFGQLYRLELEAA
jgi:GNAT superfamily N-acetyltransferase